MTKLTRSMRLKVKRDTFFLPDPNSGVYFRNNISSFRMEGNMVNQWIEKLIPVFNGEYTLGDLTDGLPAAYKDRVYEIAEVLYRNGFVRDVSQDRPHQLSNGILNKYASQIEFLDSFDHSGAFRFQGYRNTKVLAVGSGPFLVSLVSALIDSGLPKLHILNTDSVPTNKNRLKELVEHARKTDPEVVMEEYTLQADKKNSWSKLVQPFHLVLYVSQNGDVEELRLLQKICKEEKKLFIPAILLQQVGIAGPLVHPDSEGCWESVWRSLHKTELTKDCEEYASSSSNAVAMLANVIVFEMFKKVTSLTEMEQQNQFFLLDLNTLEGNWHLFLPHPLVTGSLEAAFVQDFDFHLEQNPIRADSSRLFLYFSQLTSTKSGIFHIWEEGSLKQLPLSQCRVQAVDPLSDGPAELLPDVVCSGLTHEEARREAGLAGIEEYAGRTVGLYTFTQHKTLEDRLIEPQEYVGVGAGETFTEGVCRGLQKCLTEEFSKQQVERKIFQVNASSVEDERTQFYLQALTTLQGEPIIGLGEEVFGFPVVFVGTKGRWFGSVGLNVTLALHEALQQALRNVQNHAERFSTQALEVSSVLVEGGAPIKLEIPAFDKTTHAEMLKSALQVIARNRKRLIVFELMHEPFSKEELVRVFGVLLREEESR